MANEVLDLIQQIENAAQPVAKEPLSTGDYIKGFSRSYLAGPTFNFADEAESAIAALFNKVSNPSIPISDLYSDKLARVRSEQQAFKEDVPYIDNAIELGSSLALNPLGAAGKALRATKSAITGSNLANSTGRLLSSAPLQAGVASAGFTEGNENIVSDTLKGAAIGSAGSAVADRVGKTLQNTGLNAVRSKLSSYGIGLGDINRQIKVMGDDLADLRGDIPLAKSINKYEAAGIIDAGNDVIDNFKNVIKTQDSLATELKGVLQQADAVIQPFPAFQTTVTEDYISRLSGKGRENAAAAAKEEIDALLSQIGNGSLEDLQRLKIGLNYKYDQNPYKDDVIKAIRTDLKQEIETRVNNAASQKKIPEDLFGSVKALNKEWGDLADLKAPLAKAVGSKYGSNIVNDLVQGGRTSGGTGTLNIAAATTGNPLYVAASGLLNAAGSKEGQSVISDFARDYKLPLELVGKALPELITGRTVSQATGKLSESTVAKEQEKTDLTKLSVADLIKQIESGSSKPKSDNITEIEVKGLPKSSLAEDLFSKKQPEVKKKDVSAIEQEIDQNPYYSALYEVESGRNPKAKNPKSTAKGAFQFIDDTAKRVGLKDSYDLGQSFEAVQKLTQPHAKEFGEDPRTLYAAHFLGATLLRKVLNDKPLKPEEEKNVKELINVALPRFEKIYQNKVA